MTACSALRIGIDIGHPAFFTHQPQVLQREIATRHVQDDIDAGFPPFRLKILCFIVDGLFCSQGLAPPAFFIRSCSSIDMGAKSHTQLNGRYTDAAAAAMDQEIFSGLQPACPEYVGPHCQHCLREGGGLFQAPSLRDRQALTGRDRHILRIAASGSTPMHRSAVARPPSWFCQPRRILWCRILPAPVFSIRRPHKPSIFGNRYRCGSGRRPLPGSTLPRQQAPAVQILLVPILQGRLFGLSRLLS